MKIAEKGIYELLKTLASGAVYMLRAPQNATGPFIIMQRTDSTRWRSINGPSGIAQASIQIDAYHQEPFGAKELGAEIETILDGYSGTVYYGEDSPQDFVEIGGISLQNDVDIFDQTDQPFLYRSSASYLVTYTQ